MLIVCFPPPPRLLDGLQNLPRSPPQRSRTNPVDGPRMASTSAALVIAALVWFGPALAFQGDVRAGQVRGVSLTGVVLLARASHGPSRGFRQSCCPDRPLPGMQGGLKTSDPFVDVHVEHLHREFPYPRRCRCAAGEDSGKTPRHVTIAFLLCCWAQTLADCIISPIRALLEKLQQILPHDRDAGE